ncbi:hypothetical protein QZH41_012013 [Actinostola sp. cb2023]|nr:hypothetical protein QZH41_012013 [Actinostola sp. cb2023]
MGPSYPPDTPLNMERHRPSWRREYETPITVEHESVLSILKDFCAYTTWGGLNRIVCSKYIVFKFCWLLAFIAAFGIGVFQLIGLFYMHQSKPISTRISLEHSVSLPFPSITLCNFNIILKSHINDLPTSIKDYIKKYATKRNASSQQSDTHQKSLHDDDQGIAHPDSLDRDFKITEQIAALLAIQKESKLAPLGHQFSSMIRSCRYKGVNCRNFTAGMYWSTFWHYKYGNCYTFNPKLIDGSVRKGLIASKPGPSHGLVIEFDTQQEEYIDQLTQDAGAVVQVSPRGQMPFPFEEGLSLAPGFSTSIGLDMIRISRVDQFKNHSCVNINTENNKNIYAAKFNTSYSKTACVQSCIAYNQKKHCGCMEYKYYPTDKIVCNTFDIKTVLCLRKVISKARLNQLNCSTGCPPPCMDAVYKFTSSFSSWPSENYMLAFTDKHQETNRSSDALSTAQLKSETKLCFFNRKNLLKLQIFFQDLNYEMIHEEISYKLENFIADIGGQLGLWLGVSVLSGVEIIELILHLVVRLFGKKQTKNPRNHHVKENTLGANDDFRMKSVS